MIRHAITVAVLLASSAMAAERPNVVVVLLSLIHISEPTRPY